MIVSRKYVEDLQARIKDLEGQNKALIDAICIAQGVPSPFPKVKEPIRVPINAPARQTWERKRQKLEAAERVNARH